MAEEKDPDAVREAVSKYYAKIVATPSKESGASVAASGCCGSASVCCGSNPGVSSRLGYSADDLQSLPEGANLGLGCGNPTAIGELRPGDTVVDLGSGAGIDAFLAVKQVGPSGKVIGVDMTDEMLEKARKNAETGGYTNVEFRKGTIEELPIDDGSVDVILSNCVINLSPQKQKVFGEAYRILKPGGRIMISDIVLDSELPEELVKSTVAWCDCVGGAALRADYLDSMKAAGFTEVTIVRESKFKNAMTEEDVQIMAKNYEIALDKANEALESVVSLHISAKK